jgi:sulfite reductase alpha subunit-like flavoprotein
MTTVGIAVGRVWTPGGRAGVASGWVGRWHDAFRHAAAQGLPPPVVEVECAVRNPDAHPFRMPPPNRPVVMIGAGTGTAPFRGFVEERAAALRACAESGTVLPSSPVVLVAGCRTRSSLVYRAEFEAQAAAGVISSLIVAESRATGAAAPKRTYVQDALRASGQVRGSPLGKALLCPVGHIFVCGGAKMGEGVHAALIDVYVSLWGVSAAEAEKSLAEMREKGRYVREVWH